MQGSTVKNLITKKVIEKPSPKDEEVLYDGKVMITETDKAGVITFANRKFIEMTGYSKEELIGSPHSINRHPDMPSVAFKEMWKKIKSGEQWHGIVKNMCKSGKFYWVDVWIQSKYDDKNNFIGYIAGRKIPHEKDIREVSKLYKKLLEEENP